MNCRYAVIPKGLTLNEVYRECEIVGATSLRVAYYVEEIFCDLNDLQRDRLSQQSGLAVKPLTEQVTVIEHIKHPTTWLMNQPIYSNSQMSLSTFTWEARNFFSPPLTGESFSIAILDTGVRKTHRGLQGKISYEANFTNSPDTNDHFDHGTGVAFTAVGGRPLPGEEQGAAPGANIINIKVIGDDGKGNPEDLILGIDHLIGLHTEDSLHSPYIVNMSLGVEDDGDVDNPIRVAIRKMTNLRIGIIAAAGNYGPAPSTIVIPAVDPNVLAVGAILSSPVQAWGASSRGPTKEGLVKPDLVCFGVDTLTASSKSDDAFVIKSGTSFASPFIAGSVALWGEAIARLYGFIPHPVEVFNLLLSGSRKPKGTPIEKDNTYGHGVPFGDLVIARLLER